MCGLAGILHFDRSHPVDRDLLLRMTRSIAHRGPDAEGLQVYGNVGLGHRPPVPRKAAVATRRRVEADHDRLPLPEPPLRGLDPQR